MTRNQALRLQTNARYAFTSHEHPRSECPESDLDACGACLLNGRGRVGNSDGPNFDRWLKLYVEAGKRVPSEWCAAVGKELASDDLTYRDALQESIRWFGLKVGAKTMRDSVVGGVPTSSCEDCGKKLTIEDVRIFQEGDPSRGEPRICERCAEEI